MYEYNILGGTETCIQYSLKILKGRDHLEDETRD